MPVRTFAAALCAALCLSSTASAGPIAFTLGAGNLRATDGAPQIEFALVPSAIPNQVFTAELNSPQAASFNVVAYEPWRLPTPDPRHLHPDGTAHWNNDGYFAIDVSLTDYASGQSATVQFYGRAHLYSTYSYESGWGGSDVLWFTDRREVTLGGNKYTLQGANQFTEGSGVVNVWVGSGAPVVAPEPGTLALAALGLTPLGLRRFRRK